MDSAAGRRIPPNPTSPTPHPSLCHPSCDLGPGSGDPGHWVLPDRISERIQEPDGSGQRSCPSPTLLLRTSWDRAPWALDPMADRKLVVVFGATGERVRPGKVGRAGAFRPSFAGRSCRKSGCGSHTCGWAGAAKPECRLVLNIYAGAVAHTPLIRGLRKQRQVAF